MILSNKQIILYTILFFQLMFFGSSMFGQEIKVYKDRLNLGKEGLINTKTHNFVVPPNYDEIITFRDSVLSVSSEGYYAVIDTNEQVIVPYDNRYTDFADVSNYSVDKYFEYYRENYWGYTYFIDSERVCYPRDYHFCPYFKKRTDSVPTYLNLIQKAVDSWSINEYEDSVYFYCDLAISIDSGRSYAYFMKGFIPMLSKDLKRDKIYYTKEVKGEILKNLDLADSIETSLEYRYAILTAKLVYYKYLEKDKKIIKKIKGDLPEL